MSAHDSIKFGPYLIRGKKLLRYGVESKLGTMGVKMLRILAECAGDLVTYDYLIPLIWEDPVRHDRSNVHVLRNAIKKELGEDDRLIQTIEGDGYILHHPDLVPPVSSTQSTAATQVVMMPFKDQTSLHDMAYLASGLGHEISTALANTKAIDVVKAPPAAVDRLLQRTHPEDCLVLEGFITGQSSHPAAFVEIKTPAEAKVLWQGKFPYKEHLQSLQSTQFHLAVQVAHAVRVLVRKKLGRILKDEYHAPVFHPVDDEAYKAYLKGLDHWNRPDKTNLLIAISFFEQAIDHQKDYAEAFAGISAAYNLLALGGGLPAAEAMPKADAAAGECLRIDPESPEGLTSMAGVEVYFRWNWKGAEDLLRHAIRNHDGYHTAHHLYAMGCLMPQRRFKEAIREIERAQEIENQSTFIATCVGIVYLYGRDIPKAMSQFDRAIALDKSYFLAHWHRGLALAQTGSFKEAIDAVRKAFPVSNGNPQIRAAEAYVQALSGNHGEAARIVRELEDHPGDHNSAALDLAMVYTALGEEETALNLLEEALRVRVPAAIRIGIHPAFDRLHGHPRFGRVLSQLKLQHRQRSNLG